MVLPPPFSRLPSVVSYRKTVSAQEAEVKTFPNSSLAQGFKKYNGFFNVFLKKSAPRQRCGAGSQ
ncbi:MAG: hypothetical protein IJH04_03270 [Eggerthellaceae bacterium]|nr:hypothetical protein [Eggerthellaceae bacterium]